MGLSMLRAWKRRQSITEGDVSSRVRGVYSWPNRYDGHYRYFVDVSWDLDMPERGWVLGVSIYISRRAVLVRQLSTLRHQPRERELFLCSLVVASFVVRTSALVQIEASQLVPSHNHIEAAAQSQLSHVCVRCRLPVPLS